jgi:heme peroxidase
MTDTDMSRRTLLRLGLAAGGTVVLLKGGGRALAGPASAAVGASPAPGQPAAMFGRMFPKLAPFSPDADPATALADLAALADSMLEPGGGVDTTHGALYTYFGQFVDHDVTLDLQPQPAAFFSFAKNTARSPLLDPGGNTVFDYESKKLNLSQIYGGGPGVSPQLYASDGLHFLVPANVNGVIDLPRRADGSAIIVETRNDENQILSQLHVAMLLFHNNVVDALKIKNFARAQRTVIRYYQYALLHDFMPTLFGQSVIDDLNAGNHKVYDPGADAARPIMPIEFSVAAYRFGHSLVRNAYSINPVISPNNKNARNTLFAGVGGATGPAGGTGVPLTPVGDLHGGYPLTLDHQIDWRNFSEDLFDPSVPGASLQVLKQPGGADGLHCIGQSMFGQPDASAPGTGAGLPIGGPSGAQPAGSNSIQYRDLIRGFFYLLPSGQDVAAAYGLTPIPPGQIVPSSIPGFSAGTPLFLYVLYEAFQNNAASSTVSDFDNTGTNNDFTQAQLGPVGARICVDVLLRLLELDSNGVPGNFTPQPPVAPAAGQFRISDLLTFAGVVPSGANPAPSLLQNAGPQPSVTATPSATGTTPAPAGTTPAPAPTGTTPAPAVTTATPSATGTSPAPGSS